MTVKELYESFNGNYQNALQTMMNDEFIKRMLSKFLVNNCFQDLVNHYENKNLRGVFEASHSLKGVAGTLSLTPIYEKAMVVCEKTRFLQEGESIDLDQEVGELKEAYNLVVTAISKFLN